MPKTTPPAKTKKAQATLPPIGQLFSEAFETFQRTALNLLGVWVVQLMLTIAVIIGVVISFGLLIVLTGAANSAGLSQMFTNPATAMSAVAGTAGIAIVLVIGLIGLFIYLGSAFQAATLLVVGSKEKVEIGKAISQGFKLAWPLAIVTIINSFFVMGGFFLFIVPSLIVSIFLSMSMYETVFEKRRGLTAIKSSVSIVSQNFWSVFGRIALYAVLSMFVSFVVSAIIGGMESADGVMPLFGMILNIIWQFAATAFSFAYSLTLYRHAKAAATDAQVSLKWLWITAGLGYIMFVVLMVSLVRAIPGWISALENSPLFQDPTATQQLMEEFDTSELTPEEQEAFLELQKMFEELPDENPAE